MVRESQSDLLGAVSHSLVEEIYCPNEFSLPQPNLYENYVTRYREIMLTTDFPKAARITAKRDDIRVITVHGVSKKLASS